MDTENRPTNTTAPTGNTTDGVENAPTSEQPKAPQYLTREDLNGALTSRFRREEAAMGKRFERMIADAFAKHGGQPAPAPVADPDQAAALAVLQAMEDDRKRQLADAADRERTLLERELRSETEHTLSTLGCIDPRAARLVLAEDGRIRRNANGDLVFVGDDDTEVDLATGIKAWLGTNTRWLPPRGGGDGSGTIVRQDRYRTFETSKPSRGEAERVIASWILGGGGGR